MSFGNFGPNGSAALRVLQFNDIPAPTFDDLGRTIVTPSQTVASLQVSREVTVPSTGTQDFARTVDVFQNPTNAPIITTVRIVGNLGSYAATTVFGTSDGDTDIELTDRWMVLTMATARARLPSCTIFMVTLGSCLTP